MGAALLCSILFPLSCSKSKNSRKSRGRDTKKKRRGSARNLNENVATTSGNQPIILHSAIIDTDDAHHPHESTIVTKPKSGNTPLERHILHRLLLRVLPFGTSSKKTKAWQISVGLPPLPPPRIVVLEGRQPVSQRHHIVRSFVSNQLAEVPLVRVVLMLRVENFQTLRQLADPEQRVECESICPADDTSSIWKVALLPNSPPPHQPAHQHGHNCKTATMLHTIELNEVCGTWLCVTKMDNSAKKVGLPEHQPKRVHLGVHGVIQRRKKFRQVPLVDQLLVFGFASEVAHPTSSNNTTTTKKRRSLVARIRTNLTAIAVIKARRTTGDEGRPHGGENSTGATNQDEGDTSGLATSRRKTKRKKKEVKEDKGVYEQSAFVQLAGEWLNEATGRDGSLQLHCELTYLAHRLAPDAAEGEVAESLVIRASSNAANLADSATAAARLNDSGTTQGKGIRIRKRLAFLWSTLAAGALRVLRPRIFQRCSCLQPAPAMEIE